MLLSNLPSVSPTVFATGGTRNTIPNTPPSTVGRASFQQGFPAATMTPLASGGVPPSGADFNGILHFLSDAVRWNQAGGSYPFNAAFASAIGGYPKGATILSADGYGHWMSTVDGNASNPDNGGPGWVYVDPTNASFVSRSEFNGPGRQLLGVSGYQRLPGGLVLQWGRGVTSTDTDYTYVYWPIAWPTAAFQVVVGEQNAIGWLMPPKPTVYAPVDIDLGVDRFRIYGCRINGAVQMMEAGLAFRWIAIGH
ncbi:gp53-like domain-containing protein [Bordetella sp. 02P26C-1]|uniref:gp53-like domain-containing protein n=1 Tax=Bordetella sp. 02P26C-1 TaxID=2683195 RepID=UPI001355C834|nr:hypothetical protein [Bordetella sp. 02P26C-1]MVW80166.1 hypothetical protein [Bordetella sp. 02P26C-1]